MQETTTEARKPKVYFGVTTAFDHAGRQGRAWHALVLHPDGTSEEQHGTGSEDQMDVAQARSQLLSRLGGKSKVELHDSSTLNLGLLKDQDTALVAKARRAAQSQLMREGYRTTMGAIKSLRSGTAGRVAHILWRIGHQIHLRSISNQGEMTDRVHPGLIQEIGEHGGDLVQLQGLLESMREATQELGGPVLARHIPARGPEEGKACCGRERLELALQGISEEETILCEIRTDEAWQPHLLMERRKGQQAYRLRVVQWDELEQPLQEG